MTASVHQTTSHNLILNIMLRHWECEYKEIQMEWLARAFMGVLNNILITCLVWKYQNYAWKHSFNPVNLLYALNDTSRIIPYHVTVNLLHALNDTSRIIPYHVTESSWAPYQNLIIIRDVSDVLIRLANQWIRLLCWHLWDTRWINYTVYFSWILHVQLFIHNYRHVFYN